MFALMFIEIELGCQMDHDLFIKLLYISIVENLLIMKKDFLFFYFWLQKNISYEARQCESYFENYVIFEIMINDIIIILDE